MRSQANDKPLPGGWLTVALLFFICAFNYLDRFTINTMRGSLVAAIPMNETQFGLLTSGFFWVYGCLSPFAGFLSDRFSRKWVLIGSLLWWSAMTWLTGYATSFGQLLAARILMGASEACAMPAGLAMIADYHRGATRSLATGLHMCGIQTGAGLAGLGGVLAEKHGWSYPFRLFGLLGIAYGALMCLLLRDAPRDEPGERLAPPRVRFGPAVRSLFGHRSFTLALGHWATLGVAGGMVTGWLPTFLGERFHLSQGRAGMYATAFLQPAALAGLLLGGAWADRWSRTQARARILVPFIGVCVAAPAMLLAADTSLLAVALLGLIFYTLAKAFSDSNMMPILCLVADPRYRATGYGVLNFFSCFVIGVTVYVGGALRDAHVDIGKVFACGGFALMLCAVMLFFVKPIPEAAPSPRS